MMKGIPLTSMVISGRSILEPGFWLMDTKQVLSIWLPILEIVGVVSRYMSNLGKQHWEAVKWIPIYLKGTSNTSICFTRTNLKLLGYAYANLAGDIDSRKSTNGFVYTLGGTTVCWASNLQKIVALSTTKAEM